PDGVLWFALYSYNKNDSKVLCRLHEAGITCYGSKDGLKKQVYKLVRGNHGYLWMATQTSVIGWKSSTALLYSSDALKCNVTDGIMGLAIDQDGSLLVGVAKRGPGLGLQRLSDGRWRTVSAPGFDGSELRVACIFRDRHGATWIGTVDAGVYR